MSDEAQARLEEMREQVDRDYEAAERALAARLNEGHRDGLGQDTYKLGYVDCLKDVRTLGQLLPRDEDGEIINSASFGEQWLVRITYNTDPEGKWVEDADYSNVTLHGPFDTEELADEWLMAYPDGDRDIKDMDCINFNRVRPA